MTAPRVGHRLAVALICLWFVTVVGGLALLWRYNMTPGAERDTPSDWPAGAALTRATGGHTLVMLVHPRCACSRASLSELARVMTTLSGRVSAYVLFAKPAGTTDDWEKTALWQKAAGIPDVTPVLDVDARLATLFGAETSGHTVVYGPAGQLVYSGGITSGRGHEGDNLGESELIAGVRGERTGPAHAHVYGCALNDPRTGESRVANLER